MHLDTMDARGYQTAHPYWGSILTTRDLTLRWRPFRVLRSGNRIFLRFLFGGLSLQSFLLFTQALFKFRDIFCAFSTLKVSPVLNFFTDGLTARVSFLTSRHIYSRETLGIYVEYLEIKVLDEAQGLAVPILVKSKGSCMIGARATSRHPTEPARISQRNSLLDIINLHTYKPIFKEHWQTGYNTLQILPLGRTG